MTFDNLKSAFVWMKKSPYSLWVYNEFRRRAPFFTLPRLNDKQAIDVLYKRYLNREMDWVNHKRFTEKMQLLKFYYAQNPLVSVLVDKYRVREYLQNRGYGFMLNEMLGMWYDVNQIDLDALPDRFVLKATHGSSWNIVCNDKKQLRRNWFIYKKLMKSWLKQDLGIYGRERFYHNAKPGMIGEKFLMDYTGALTDYKFFCFNGKVKLIQVDSDRYGNWKENYYDTQWNLFDLKTGKPHFDNDDLKPKSLSKMEEIAKELSQDFPFVRVDFYEVNDRIVFGELTFIDGSGFYSMDPDEFDYQMGEWLVLPDDIDRYIPK